MCLWRIFSCPKRELWQSCKQNCVFNREYSCVYEENLLPVDGGLSYTIMYKLVAFLQNCEVTALEVSFKKLWKLLIDKDMKKKDLQASAGISWASVTKLSKNENVSMEVLMKVCQAMNCDIGDIMEFVDEQFGL